MGLIGSACMPSWEPTYPVPAHTFESRGDMELWSLYGELEVLQCFVDVVKSDNN